MASLSRRQALALGIGVMMSDTAFAQAQDVSERFSALLDRYVVRSQDGVNRVSYGRWKTNAADTDELARIVAAYAQATPSRMQRTEQFAYWANLYNAITLNLVLGRYPVASIREIRSEGVLDPRALLGPWRTRAATVEGRRLSLDDIEHNILRPQMRDARVHYAVNCASIGCPNLQPRAWSAATLEQDLDAAARAFVNHPRAVSVLPGGGLRTSSLYEWYQADFGGNDAGVIAHLRRYASPALSDRLARAARLSAHDYDWALNDVAPS